MKKILFNIVKKINPLKIAKLDPINVIDFIDEYLLDVMPGGKVIEKASIYKLKQLRERLERILKLINASIKRLED